jgi:hypothetical protein
MLIVCKALTRDQSQGINEEITQSKKRGDNRACSQQTICPTDVDLNTPKREGQDPLACCQKFQQQNEYRQVGAMEKATGSSSTRSFRNRIRDRNKQAAIVMTVDKSTVKVAINKSHRADSRQAIVTRGSPGR